MIMNTKQSYPVTDSITNAVEAGIITATVVSLIACLLVQALAMGMWFSVHRSQDRRLCRKDRTRRIPD